MAKLSKEEFYDKWVPLLADNVFQDIDGKRFEQLLADLRDSFASADSQSQQPVAPAVNFDPVLRQLTATHLLGVSELEYNHNNGGFTAYAPVQVDDLGHGQGEWRFRVKAATGRNASQTTDSPLLAAKGSANPAGPGKIKAVDISDSTEAGRALLTAADVSAQRELLDKFVILAGQYGIGQPRFEHVAGADGLHAYLLRSLASLAASAAPAAPTAGQVDDTGDVFSFLPPSGYSFAQLKVAGLPQTTGAEWLSAANSYVQNGRVYVRVIGAVAKGGLAVYVGASGNVPDGQVLTNEADFTANNVVPLAPGALQVAFKVDNASLSPGDSLTFTAKASGGTAPYRHSVHALNPDTGDVTVLGTASTATYVGTWPSVPAGVYLVTDAVTDSAGASLVSVARRVVIAAPGSGGGALVPATRTRLGGVRIGNGLEVAPDGLLGAEVQLQKANVWQEVGDYSAKGLKLPIGSFINDGGRLFIRQVDVGQKHFTFGRYYSLAKDALIQWKPDDFLSQDGDGDVGLARVGPGVLEVNTGTAGSRATLLVKDMEAENAPPTLNNLEKIGAALGLRANLLTTAKTSLVAAINELLAKIPVAGLGLEIRGGLIGLRTSVARVYLGAGTGGGFVSQFDGTVVTTSQFAPPSANYTYSAFIALPPPGTPYSIGPFIPQQAAFYDANFQFVRALNVYQDPSAGVIPPDCYFAKVSVENANYNKMFFAFNTLPYTRSINGVFPNAEGDVQVPVGALINPFTGTAAVPQAVTTTQFYFTGTGLYQWVGKTGPVASLDKANADWRVVVEGGGGGGASGPALDTFDKYLLSDQKRADVLADYAAKGVILETDSQYFDVSFIDDYTTPGTEYKYECTPSVSSGSTVWKWRCYKQGK